MMLWGGDSGTYLSRALRDGHANITGESRNERIHYIAANHSERWNDPEEKVRAEFWAELIYKYEYPAERIRFEDSIPDRTPVRKADLVIYSDGELLSPYYVFECKAADVSDAEFNQAIKQAVANRNLIGGKYCGAVSGTTRRLLSFDGFPPGERDRNHMTDIPVRYGLPPEWRFYKNVPGKDLAAIPREELRVAIRKCHQTLWEGGRRSPIAAFGEFCKIVFIKHRDEKDLDRQDGQPYAFQRRNGETSEGLHQRIIGLYEAEKEREPDVFTESINVTPPILAQCVEHLEGISLDRTELDTKGVAFEEFMGGFFKGDFGQYFTPRELIAFSVAMLEPKRADVILDPACGSGGFLLYALDHVRREADSRFPMHTTDPRQSVGHFNYWHGFAQNNLFGIEVNDELARVAKMNMIIHDDGYTDDGYTNVVGHDALDFPVNIADKNSGLAEGKFDLILTNPPFGATIKRTEKGDGYLEQFELMRYLRKDYPLHSEMTVHSEMTGEGDETDRRLTPKSFRPRASIKTEIAFLERIHSFLKPGEGKAAVVLPDAILTNSSLQGVRHWLLNRFQLLAVVSLPQFAFQHYDAGVKASIVFLRRLADGETVPDDTPIFMALTDNIGYDATGRKTFNSAVESEEPGREKVEIHSCDLFDYRVYYEWSSSGVGGWSERRREVISATGLLGEWREFQRDPTPFFRVSPSEQGEAHCFAVRRGLSAKRLDVWFNHPRYALLNARLDTATVATPQLGEFVGSIVGGATPKRSDNSLYADSGVKFLRILNINDGEILEGDIKYITGKVHQNDLSRSQLDAGDVLMTITGRVGSAAVVDSEHLPANINQHIARLRIDQARCRPEFLSEWLNCPTGLELSNRFVSGGTRSALDYGAIRNIRVPLPDLPTQDKLLAAMDAARAERRAKLAEAEAEWQAARQWFEEQLLG
jgi:type I restriction enzyme M protein